MLAHENFSSLHPHFLSFTHCIWQHTMRRVCFASRLTTAKVGSFFSYPHYFTAVFLCHTKSWCKLALHILTRKLVTRNRKQQKMLLHYEHPEVHNTVILKIWSFSDPYLIFCPLTSVDKMSLLPVGKTFYIPKTWKNWFLFPVPYTGVSSPHSFPVKKVTFSRNKVCLKTRP